MTPQPPTTTVVEQPVPVPSTTPSSSLSHGLTTSSSSSSSSSDNNKNPTVTIFLLPAELQVHMLSFLRAFDLSHVQHTCRFYNDPVLIHKVVTHQANYVYTRQYVVGPLTTATTNTKTTAATSTTTTTTSKQKRPAKASAATTTTNQENEEIDGPLCTLEDLRHMELTVVARILSTPEPKTGFYVSKSWIKKTLLWLEKVNEEEQEAAAAHAKNPKRKLSKKQVRQRSRRLSDVSPPWPNVNSDLLCPHSNLQRCGTKSARSRRRLLDKQAWKILKKLYPESSQLESVSGECLQCLVETETTKRTEQAMAEQRKLERKQPLTNPLVRRFYTRTRGVPTQYLVGAAVGGGGCGTATGTAQVSDTEADDDEEEEDLEGEENVATGDEAADDNDDTIAHQKPKAMVVMTKEMPRLTFNTTSNSPIPLLPGTYHLLPRAWCHQWRKYIKTGEGSLPLPPDASALLCHAHRLPLLPPHFEAYIYGETSQLLTSITTGSSTTPQWCEEVTSGSAAASRTLSSAVVGIRPALDPTAVQALLSAGLSPAELAVQQRAMMQFEQLRRQVSLPPPPRAAATPLSIQSLNDLLDSENHMVVEIVPDDEWRALQETKSWPRQHHFSVSFTVVDEDEDHSGRRRHISYSTLPCRDCDASGKASSSNLCLKNRARGLAHNKRNTNPQQQPQTGKKTLQKGDHQKALTLTVEY